MISFFFGVKWDGFLELGKCFSFLRFKVKTRPHSQHGVHSVENGIKRNALDFCSGRNGFTKLILVQPRDLFAIYTFKNVY